MSGEPFALSDSARASLPVGEGDIALKKEPMMTSTVDSIGVGTRTPLVVTPATTPRSLNVVGEQITVLASGAQTGSYEIFRQAGPEGSGPPPHNHPWDEAFYVVSGEIAFGVGDQDLVAVPGTLVHLPAGTMHWFRFGPGGGEMISMTSREGASHLFTDIDREVSPEQPDVDKLVAVAQSHGLTIGGA